ncbi:MAG: hypothetical protein IPG52_14875 [Rhodocyclaceae bacterium]|nr:hypothetical protein [Rhodocyclaceae bacterium]
MTLPRLEFPLVKISAMSATKSFPPFASPDEWHDHDPLIWVGIELSGDDDCAPDSVRDALKAFNGSVAWGYANGDNGHRNFDVIYAEVDDQGAHVSALVGIPNPATGYVTDWLTVSSVTPTQSPQAYLLTTVLAPSFAPGLVGVDWDDIKALLRSGHRALLAVFGGPHQDSIGRARQAIDQALETLGSPPIAGVLGLLVSSSQQVHMSDVNSLFMELHDLVPTDEHRIGAAAIRDGGEPWCAMLTVVDPNGCAKGVA